MKNKIEMHIMAISRKVANANSFAIILGEKNGLRQVSVLIGVQEAQSITTVLEKIKINRPLTHDLMCQIFQQLNVQVHAIEVYAWKDSIYYSQIIAYDAHQNRQAFECRLSDAIAVAVREKVPIYMEEHILEQIDDAVFIPPEMPKQETNDLAENKDFFNIEQICQLSESVLQEKLKEFVDKEDYLIAALIRDELKNRTSNKNIQ